MGKMKIIGLGVIIYLLEIAKKGGRMSNIINVKEEGNILSFSGEVAQVVANSTNFYLKFEFDEVWLECPLFTVIFSFGGKREYVELDDEFKCQIPPTNSEKILFCVTAEPRDGEKFSSTILSLDVEESGETDLSNIEVYENVHRTLLGLIGNLKTGKGVVAEKAGFSETQVSLTGNDTISGEKNFTGTLKSKSEIVPNATDVSNYNYIINGDFSIDQRGGTTYTRTTSDIYTVDRWGLFGGQGKFRKNNKTLYGLDETTPVTFCQWVHDAKDLLLGKTVTVSALVNGVRRSKTMRIPLRAELTNGYHIENIYEAEGYTFRVYVWKTASTRVGVQFLVANGYSITLDEVKLEISNFATKFVQPVKCDEIAKCQRYYQNLYIYSLGYGLENNKIQFFVPTPTTMASAATVKIQILPKVYKDGTSFQADNVQAYLERTNGLILYATGAGIVENEAYLLMNGKIEVETELY